MQRKAKSADVDFRAYETEAVAKRFDAIRKRLMLDCNHDSLTNTLLATLTAHLIQMNDDALGINSKIPRNITKLPMKLFHDYKSSGSVYYILWAYFQERRTFRFAPLALHEARRLLQIFMNGLVRIGLLQFPKVHFSAEITEEDVKTLSSIVLGHSGTILSKPDHATHIIIPPPKERNLTEEEEMIKDPEFLRALQIRRDFVLVHWWYYPDSYDTWLTTKDIAGKVPDPKPVHTGQWTISCGWLLDLEKFNEYMNENDYTPEEILAEKQVRVPLSSPIDKKEEKRGPPDGREENEPPKKKQKIQEDYEERKTTLLANAPQKNNVAVVRVECPWFEYDKISEYEKKEMGEFFDSRSPSKNPSIYMEYRNFMIQTYEQNPTQYLSQTACRRNLAGDVCSIMRVHMFLESSNLINSRVNPDLFPFITPTTSQNMGDENSLPGKSNLNNKKVSEPSSSSTVALHIRPEVFHGELNDISLREEEWNEREILSLLRAIETNPDDWGAISAAVGTKSKEQCILRFVRMPIEDRYVESFSVPTSKDRDHLDSDAGESAGAILSLMELLSNSVDPQAMTIAYDSVRQYYRAKNNNTSTENDPDAMDENSDTDRDDEDDDISIQVRAACAASITEASLRADTISKQEESEIHRLVQEVIELQVQKIQLKLDELEKQI